MDPTRLPEVRRLIDLAVAEDLGRGDVTTAAVLDGDGGPVRADIAAREDLIVCGVDVARAVFAAVDPSVAVDVRLVDGARAERGAAIIALAGPAAAILAAERTALNFLQRLSGIATRVVDTRKTTPGWRVLEKEAVRAGGCHNHRADLGSGVLIKDNHIAACGGVAAALDRARARAPHGLKIEVEVDGLAQLDAAIGAGADVVLLDNMTHADVVAATARAHAAGILVEVSGGITLERLPSLVAAGVDLVSIGALTHSSRAVDIALDFA